MLRSFGKTRPTCLTGDGLNIALHGDDHTKAVKRAVQDALHRSSLSLFRSLKIDPNTMEIELRLAAQEPDKIDLEAVAETLPYGKVSPVAVTGGLNVPDGHNGRQGVIVNAGVIVRLPV